MTIDKRRRVHVSHLEDAFGVTIDPELLERALTHRSYAYENGGLPTNERLEFLGDSVLGVVITTALFLNHPDLPEGQLAKLRASVVNMRALAEVARGLGPDGLGAYLLLGKGEETTGGRDKASILADTLEALIGAIYLQYGLDTTAKAIHKLFDPLMAESANRGASLDWKTSLQELTAARGLGVPEYRIDQEGPDHLKTFTAWVIVAGVRYGGAEGRSKKEAEQRAAEAAWRTLAGPAGEGAAGTDRNTTTAGAPDPAGASDAVVASDSDVVSDPGAVPATDVVSVAGVAPDPGVVSVAGIGPENDSGDPAPAGQVPGAGSAGA